MRTFLHIHVTKLLCDYCKMRACCRGWEKASNVNWPNRNTNTRRPRGRSLAPGEETVTSDVEDETSQSSGACVCTADVVWSVELRASLSLADDHGDMELCKAALIDIRLAVLSTAVAEGIGTKTVEAVGVEVATGEAVEVDDGGGKGAGVDKSVGRSVLVLSTASDAEGRDVPSAVLVAGVLGAPFGERKSGTQ